MSVYVLNIEGKPLMDTVRYGKVRRLLDQGLAIVKRRNPFTIRLLYETTEYTQPITLGIDSGYGDVGFSAVSDKKEHLSGELKLLQGMSERLKERAMYRRQRRRRLRYRKPRFDNRKRTEGWLAPSIQHKVDSHIRLVNLIKEILPITKVIMEVANFDIQAIKDPTIEGTGYQKGEQMSFWNLREYILHRDNHVCQNPNCKNKSKQAILEIHHLGYWKDDRSDRPANLITLCTRCHTPANHKKGKFLYGWEPRLKSFRPETFISVVRWKLVHALEADHTYGFATKSKRIEHHIEKTHFNDAFVIAGGSTQSRIQPIQIEQVRRNNRSLEKFYDAQYMDIRTGQKASGQELGSGRRTRNKGLNGENLRVYRGHKIKEGQRRIRTQRYEIQPKDTVVYLGQRYLVKGIQNYGEYVKLDGPSKPVRTDRVKLHTYGKGLKVV